MAAAPVVSFGPVEAVAGIPLDTAVAQVAHSLPVVGSGIGFLGVPEVDTDPAPAEPLPVPLRWVDDYAIGFLPENGHLLHVYLHTDFC